MKVQEEKNFWNLFTAQILSLLNNFVKCRPSYCTFYWWRETFQKYRPSCLQNHFPLGTKSKIYLFYHNWINNIGLFIRGFITSYRKGKSKGEEQISLFCTCKKLILGVATMLETERILQMEFAKCTPGTWSLTEIYNLCE